MQFQPGPAAVSSGSRAWRRIVTVFVWFRVPPGPEQSCGEPRRRETPDRWSGSRLLPLGPTSPPGVPALSPVMEWVARNEYVHRSATEGEVMDAYIFER